MLHTDIFILDFGRPSISVAGQVAEGACQEETLRAIMNMKILVGVTKHKKRQGERGRERREREKERKRL